MRASAIRIEKMANIKEWLSKNTSDIRGKAIPAEIELIDTYPVIRSITRNTAMHKSVTRGFSESSTPNVLATPLPPLKPAKTGKTCPTIAIMPVMICILINSADPGGANFSKAGRLAASHPLPISIKSTGIPVVHPRTLMVFVAPALPLPCSRISIPWNSLPAHTEVAREPSAYANRETSMKNL